METAQGRCRKFDHKKQCLKCVSITLTDLGTGRKAGPFFVPEPADLTRQDAGEDPASCGSEQQPRAGTGGRTSHAATSALTSHAYLGTPVGP